MFNSQSKILGRIFRKVDGVVWDLSTNALGLQNNNGIYTLTRTEEPGRGDTTTTVFGVSVNPFDSFGFAIPAFAQLTKLENIEVGDLIIGDKGALGWVTKVNQRSLQLLDQAGMAKNYTPPKLAVLNQDGALVVKSLTGLFGAEGATGFSNALLPLLLAGDGLGSGLDDLLPIMLLTQQQSGNNGNALASALPTILMVKAMSGGNGGKLENLLLPMILSGGLGGNGSAMNPLFLMALTGNGGLNVGSQYVAGDTPALQARNVTSNVSAGIPPLTRVHR